MKRRKWHIGDFYEDCMFHPCLVTYVKGDDLRGISLIDGSEPRGCSIQYCCPRKLTMKQVLRIKENGPICYNDKEKEVYAKQFPERVWWLKK